MRGEVLPRQPFDVRCANGARSLGRVACPIRLPQPTTAQAPDHQLAESGREMHGDRTAELSEGYPAGIELFGSVAFPLSVADRLYSDEVLFGNCQHGRRPY